MPLREVSSLQRFLDSRYVGSDISEQLRAALIKDLAHNLQHLWTAMQNGSTGVVKRLQLTWRQGTNTIMLMNLAGQVLKSFCSGLAHTGLLKRAFGAEKVVL